MPNSEIEFMNEVDKLRKAGNCSDFDILNLYRNFYHTANSNTEHGLVAQAINGLFNSIVNNELYIIKREEK